jgi:hypothetical protein
MTDRSDEPEPLRVVAASATISNPAEHLHALTGLQFESINEASDGSPQHSRHILHVAATPGNEASLAVDLQKTLFSARIPGASLPSLIPDRERNALQSRLMQMRLCDRIVAAMNAPIVMPSNVVTPRLTSRSRFNFCFRASNRYSAFQYRSKPGHSSLAKIVPPAPGPGWSA